MKNADIAKAKNYASLSSTYSKHIFVQSDQIKIRVAVQQKAT